MAGSQTMHQAGMNRIGVVDMVAVRECGNYGNGSLAQTAFEPYYDDKNNLSLQIL
jgi:hypothetical protein